MGTRILHFATSLVTHEQHAVVERMMTVSYSKTPISEWAFCEVCAANLIPTLAKHWENEHKLIVARDCQIGQRFENGWPANIVLLI